MGVRCLLLLACATASAATRYDLRVQLSPHDGSLQVQGAVEMAATGGEREARFLINRGLEVRSASCPVCVNYTFDRSLRRQFLFASEGAPLVFHFVRPLQKAERVRFEFDYGGKLLVRPNNVDALGPDWVELALYSAWFPFQPDRGRFTYKLAIGIEPAWSVSGAGRLGSVSPGRWLLEQDEPATDINIVASKNLRSHRVEAGQRQIRVDEVTLGADAAERVARESGSLTQWFAAWFGPSGSGQLTIVYADRAGGGGYSRNGFVCYETAYMSKLSSQQATRALAHEIAHFWWTGAPVENWEDWLNESFAEYSALMALRKSHGNESFEAELALFREKTAGAPAIRGIPRHSPDAYRVLYMKGPLMLYRLEQAMGQQNFLKLLRVFATGQPRSTDRLLALVERFGSRELRDELETALRR